MDVAGLIMHVYACEVFGCEFVKRWRNAAGVDEQIIAEITGHCSSSVRAYKRTSDEQQYQLSEILYGSDRGSDCGEKKVKKVENEEKEKSTEVRIGAGNMKISVIKFLVDYKLKGIEFLCVDVMDEA